MFGLERQRLYQLEASSCFGLGCTRVENQIFLFSLLAYNRIPIKA